MIITILIDNDSWIIPYANILNENIIKLGHDSKIIFKHKNIREGDLLILLGCIRMFKKLNLNKNNIVVHESDLPKGKGWSPLTWQILSGMNKIPISLFEASNSVDSGKIYLKDYIYLDGYELYDEIKKKQGEKTNEMILKYIKENPIGKNQLGNETFYNKRTPKDSELDVNKTILEQFNLLRVCSNKDYPSYFKINNKKYILKIYNE